MTRRWRNAVLIVLVIGSGVAGWRLIGQLQAERYASTDPVRALRWRSDHPAALLALAERQLADRQPVAAQATARRLLAREPLYGEAFRILAQASEQQGLSDQALSLYQVAARRAPRDLATRAWLAQHYLRQGDYPRALGQLDVLLRVAPQRAKTLHPALVQLAQDPAFARALAATLRTDPPWRAGFMTVLRDPRRGNVVAAGNVMGALQAQGGLAEDEYARWLDSLIAQGRWGEAYARWASRAAKTGGRLPLVYNGDFADIPSDNGFDWRRRRVPGVLLQFEPAVGRNGQAAYLQFLGRRVPNAGLEQPLLLEPGDYRLTLQLRAQSLRSEMGLQWQVVCAGPAGVVARSEAIDGNFGWRELAVAFTIPDAGCPGQWLRLVNPVPIGPAQRVEGQLWLTDVAVDRRAPATPAQI